MAQKRNINWNNVLLGTGVAISAVGLTYVIAKEKRGEELPPAERYSKEQTKGSNISGSQALRKANQLFTAMDGPNWDNSADVVRPLAMVNAPGLYLIVNKFGRRAGTYTIDKENLYQWFQGESDKTQLYARAVWKNRGLTPPF